MFLPADMCEPGKFSNTTLVPCDTCPKGTYQPGRGASSCVDCPQGKTTLTPGATDSSDCRGGWQGRQASHQMSSHDVSLYPIKLLVIRVINEMCVLVNSTYQTAVIFAFGPSVFNYFRIDSFIVL